MAPLFEKVVGFPVDYERLFTFWSNGNTILLENLHLGFLGGKRPRDAVVLVLPSRNILYTRADQAP